MSTELYLIALVPHEELRERVRSLKLEMKERFNATHALKAPAHITLQMPFRQNEELESKLTCELENFSVQQDPFKIHISGFDAFPPRVIFLKITDHIPIISLHSELKNMLANQLELSEKEIINTIHPHMTIATRDLRKKMFHKAWPEFEKRNFEASFTVNRLHLLKHNGKHWELHRELMFEGDKKVKSEKSDLSALSNSKSVSCKI